MIIPEINKLYIIESLSEKDTKTGFELYEDLKSWIPSVFSDKDVEYIPVANKQNFNNFFDSLYKDIDENKIIPIIHFEIHGDSNGRGLVLSDGDLVSIEELGDQLRRCNIGCGCRLFITLAVCHGLMNLFSIHSTKPMPFCGILGSLDDLYEHDIQIRFKEFYQELFSSFDLQEATRSLMEANGSLQSKYECHMAGELFIKSYHGYIKNICTPKALKRRAMSCFKSKSREDQHRFNMQFVIKELQTRDKEYRSFRDRFFMVAKFPENIERFSLPKDTKGLVAFCRQKGW